MALIYISLAFLGGIWLGSYLDFPLALMLSGLPPLGLLFITRKRKPVIIASLCLFAFFGGGWHYQQSLPQNNSGYILNYNDSTITLNGVLNRDSDFRDTTAHGVPPQKVTTCYVRL